MFPDFNYMYLARSSTKTRISHLDLLTCDDLCAVVGDGQWQEVEVTVG